MRFKRQREDPHAPMAVDPSVQPWQVQERLAPNPYGEQMLCWEVLGCVEAASGEEAISLLRGIAKRGGALQAFPVATIAFGAPARALTAAPPADPFPPPDELHLQRLKRDADRPWSG